MAKSITVSTTIPAEMKAKLDAIAEKEDRKISWVIRKAIEQYLYGLEDVELNSID